MTIQKLLSFKKSKKLLPIILLTLIVFCGLVLRIYKIDSIPSGFFADEASIGYNAYTILTSGKDEYGTPFPLFFRAFGEYKSPIQTYSTVPFIFLFGLNEFSVRLTSAFYGTLGIIALYLLVKSFPKKQKYSELIALSAAFLLATAPWHIHFSRVSLEGLMAFITLTTFGFYSFVKAQKRPVFLFFSILCFTLALYSYFPARIFIPIFGISLIFMFPSFFLRNRKIVFMNAAILFILLIPFFQNSLSESGMARWKQVSIFTNTIQNESPFTHIVQNYISHFSPNFLFLKGDIDMPGQFITRHSVRGIGELYLFQLPFILFGLIYLVKTKQFTILLPLLMWLVLYPTGSMFTTDKSAQATRSIIGVIPLTILSAYGFYAVVFLMKNKYYTMTVSLIMTLIVVFSFLNFTKLYFVQYPQYSSDFWGWQYGASDIVHYFREKQNRYDELIMAPEFNAPDIFFKFYAPNDCTKCFVGTPDTHYQVSKKQLFAVTPTYLTEHPDFKLRIRSTIYYPNRSIAFQIGEIVQ